jgi:GNAT superfamily N-acetyltransferase
VNAITVRSANGFVPGALGALAALADAEGTRNVRRLIEQWRRGEERFDRSGERLLVAVTDSGEVVGIGGLTLCPTVPGALRVRRFYVHPAWRRRGVARQIASTLLAQWPPGVAQITCNARASAAAPQFWEAMSFEPTDVVGLTHVLTKSHPLVP